MSGPPRIRRPSPLAALSPLLLCGLLAPLAGGCQGGPDVQIEHRSAGFSRDALRRGTVAVLPPAVVGGAGSADLDRAAAGAIPGRALAPAEVLSAARAAGAEQHLAAAVERFRATRGIDSDALGQLTAAWPADAGRPDYYALVRLQDLQTRANPSLAGSLRHAQAGGARPAKAVYSAGATVRLAVVRAGDGETVFVAVTSVQREAAAASGPSPTSALPNHPFGGYADDGQRRAVEGAGLPAITREALRAIVARMGG